MSDRIEDWQEMKPLPKLTCSSSDCQRDLHCFRTRRPRREQSYRNGCCVACSSEMIDWQRLDQHSLSDVSYTFEALEHEMFRHHYWHNEIDDQAKNDAEAKGLTALSEAAMRRLKKSVARPSREIFRDGTQTPLSGNILFYAQHATATCCRKCIEEWHGIDRNRPLTEEEIQFMSELLILYIRRRLPDLPE